MSIELFNAVDRIKGLTNRSVASQFRSAQRVQRINQGTSTEIQSLRKEQKEKEAPLIKRVEAYTKEIERLKGGRQYKDLDQPTKDKISKAIRARSSVRGDLSKLKNIVDTSVNSIKSLGRATSSKEKNEALKVINSNREKITQLERGHRRALKGDRIPAWLSKTEAAELKGIINKPTGKRTKSDNNRLQELYTKREGPIDASKMVSKVKSEAIPLTGGYDEAPFGGKFELYKSKLDEKQAVRGPPETRLTPDNERPPSRTGQQPSPDVEGVEATTDKSVSQDERWQLTKVPRDVPISDIEKKERHDALLKGLHTMLGVQDALGSITQARLQYQQVQGQSDINKRLIDDEIQDTLSAGKQQAAIEHARGKTAAESDQLRLAAQGQSLSGAGAERVERSHQVMAAANAADARSASIARGLGLEYEKVSLDRQLAYADINKTAATWRGLTSAAFGLAEASIHAKRAKIGYGDTKTVYDEVLKDSEGNIRKTRKRELYRRDSQKQNKRFGY